MSKAKMAKKISRAKLGSIRPTIAFHQKTKFKKGDRRKAKQMLKQMGVDYDNME